MHHTIFSHSDADVAAIGVGFLERTLPKAAWTHAGHFTATLWILARRPDIDAPRQLPQLIRAYNEATGVANTDTGGYHETITQASLRAAQAFLAARPTEPLYVSVNALLASHLGRHDWMLAHWSKERLFSVEARRAWVEPDVQPLPFCVSP
jgi:hypothetical protein